MASKGDDRLAAYRAKRDFGKTAEPSGARASKLAADSLAFCVQKHDATRLHYDFRIEWEGVLKSWAVTKGPSLDPADKRLAVRTEDHPMEYGDFEGTIPAGQYGGGTVMLWDRGTWEPEGDAAEGLTSGNLKMRLHGEKMDGRWVLVRMKPRAKERAENWLLIKEKDETADSGYDLLALDRSVKTGRDLDEIARGDEVRTLKTVHPRAAGGQATAPTAPAKAAGKSRPKKAANKPPAKARTKAAALPQFREPQLATLVDQAPAGADWLHEMKYDGYRVLITMAEGAARCFTRNALDWTDKFAGIAAAAARLPCRSALIDGEIVAFDENGGTDFSTLQAHLSEGGPLSCFCFDLLSLDGEDLTGEPLVSRKRRLEALLGKRKDPLLFSEHVAGNGAAVFKSVCAGGHEGIVSKRADAPYRSGRGRSWLKVKCIKRQEFVIGGFSRSDKKNRAFSSLLVGVNENGALHYRGRVGSGFDGATLERLAAQFAPLGRKTSPFSDLPPAIAKNASFVAPRLVAEVELAEFTAENQIRHGVFKGLREDKEADAVVDEKPQPVEPTQKGRTRATKAGDGETTSVAGLRLTSPDRVVFPGQGHTKLDLARYYEAVAPRMLLYAGERPLSLVRCPQGRQRHCFFQKHDSGGFPDAIGRIAISEKDGDVQDYLFVRDAAGLVAAVQMGTLEFHIWGSPNARLERPDRLVFDLDPDEAIGFEDVREAAFYLRDRLDALGLASFAMVTGGKGVHVVAPLARRQEWDTVKGFARDFATGLVIDEPQRFVATMSKARRKGRIFIDWLRNERGATAVAPYSTRSREGAPVAVPVTWDELASLDRANGFSPEAVRERLQADDPWSGYRDVSQSITKRMLAAVASS